jgi:hypothetical protein
MKKMTNLLKNDSNTNYSAKIDIILDNGTVLESTVKVSEFNESFAKEVTTNNLKNASISSFVVKEIEPIVEKKEDKEDKNDCCYYIPLTAWLAENSYDSDLIKKTVKDCDCVSDVKEENQYGWDSQPKVVCFKINKTGNHMEDTLVKERIENKLKEVLCTEWVRVSKKDW